MSDLSQATGATAAGTRENILVVANNVNNNVNNNSNLISGPNSGAIKGANNNNQQQSSSVSKSLTKGLLSSHALSPGNSIIYTAASATAGVTAPTAPTPTSAHLQQLLTAAGGGGAGALSQSSSRSSLCTPRSSAALFNSDLELLMEAHAHHQQQQQQQQQQHLSSMHPSLAHYLESPGGAPVTGDSLNSIYSSTRLAFLDQANNNGANSSNQQPSVVKMRNKGGGVAHASGLINGPVGTQQQSSVASSKLMHQLIASDSGLSSMLPSASSSSSLMASSGYLGGVGPSGSSSLSSGPPHHLQHSFSSSSVPSSTHTIIRNLHPYATIGLGNPSSASSVSSNSSSMLHQVHGGGGLGLSGSSVPQLIIDYGDDYGSTTATAAGAAKARAQQAAAAQVAAAQQAANFTSAMLNQYRQSTGSSGKLYHGLGSTDTRSDYESLYKKYADLDHFHNEVVSKLSMAAAENATQRKKMEEILKMSASLKAQCAMDARENSQLKEQLELVKKQRDDAHKECNNAMVGKSKAIKEKQRMYEERNTAVSEYNLIMSERDLVHKEIERLQEDLGAVHRRNEALEKENKASAEELESLKRELASALLDRDQALKAAADAKAKLAQQSVYGSIQDHGYYDVTSNSSSSSLHGVQSGHLHGETTPGTSNATGGSSSGPLGGLHWPLKSFGLSSFKSGVNHLSNNSSTSSVLSSQHHHHFSAKTGLPDSVFGTSPGTKPGSGQFGAQLVPANANFTVASPSASIGGNLDQMEGLRKAFDRLQIELQEAHQEIEVCKKRRDWAFSERDKIVQERESIRTLCDKLRRERDRKVSDLAEALRDSDEIKRQKNETAKELKELKERMDSNGKGSSGEGKDEKSPAKSDKNCDSPSEANSKAVPEGSNRVPVTNSGLELPENCTAYSTTPYLTTVSGSEVELLEVHLKKTSTGDCGFKVKVDDSLDIVVSSLSASNSASPLRLHDTLLRVNGISISSLMSSGAEPSNKHSLITKVEALLRESGPSLDIQLRRRRCLRTVASVILPKMDHPEQSSFLRRFGFDAECTLIVNRIDPSASTPTASGLSQARPEVAVPLNTGDRIIAINGTSLNNLFGSLLVHFMLQQQAGVRAQVVRFVPNTGSPLKVGPNLGFPPVSSAPGNRLSVNVDQISHVEPPLPTPPPPHPSFLTQTQAQPGMTHRASLLQERPFIEPNVGCAQPQSQPPPATVQLPIIMSSRGQKLGPHLNELTVRPVLPEPTKSHPSVPKSNFYPIISINSSGPEAAKLGAKSPEYSAANAALSQSILLRQMLSPTTDTSPQAKAPSQQSSGPSPSSVPLPVLIPQPTQAETSSDEDDDDDDDDGPTFVVDEDNDADADDDDDDDSTTTATSDEALAALDAVLLENERLDGGNDYYGSTVTNSSGSSLLVMPLVPGAQSLLQPQQAPPQQQQSSTSNASPMSHHQSVVEVPSTYEPIIPLGPVSGGAISVAPVQLQPGANSGTQLQPQQSQQAQTQQVTVVRRSSRKSTKKTRSQRCTLAASQLEAAHELTLALSAANHHKLGAGGGVTGSSSGDTWPRYRPPNQLLSSVLPSFYKAHGHELQQLYSKQGHPTAIVQTLRAPGHHHAHQPGIPAYDEITYFTTIHTPRRKQRKSLNVFGLDISPGGAGGSQAQGNSENSGASTVNRRSPRVLAGGEGPSPQGMTPSESNYAAALAAGAISFDAHQQMAYSSRNSGLIDPATVIVHHHSPVGEDGGSKGSALGTSSMGGASGMSHRSSVHYGTVLGLGSADYQTTAEALKMATIARACNNNNYNNSLKATNTTSAKPPSSPYYAPPAFVAPPPPTTPASGSSVQQQQQQQLSADNPYGTYSNPLPNHPQSHPHHQQSSSSVAAPPPPSSYSPIYSTYSSYRAASKSTVGVPSDSSSPQKGGGEGGGAVGGGGGAPPSNTESLYAIYGRTMPCSSSSSSNGGLHPLGGPFLGPSLGPNSPSTPSVDYSVVSAQSQDKNVLKYYKTRQSSGSSQTGVPPLPPLETPLLIPPYTGPTSGSSGPGIGSSSAKSKSPGTSQNQNQTSSQTRSRLLLTESLYGTTTGAASLPSNSASAALSSLYGTYNPSNDIYGQTRASNSAASSAGAAKSQATTDIYGTIGRGPPPAALGPVSSSSPSASASYYGPSSGSPLFASGLPPNSAAHLLANRHSMNLALLEAVSGSGSGPSDILLAHAHHRNSLLLNSSALATASGPPLYDHRLHEANLVAYGPPGSSKTLPNKHSNTLLSLSGANPRASYKETNYSAVNGSSAAGYSGPVYPDTRGAGITASQAATSHYLPDSLYGTLLKGSSQQQRATPPPPPAPAYGAAPSSSASADPETVAPLGSRDFEENFCQALNLMSSPPQGQLGPGSTGTTGRVHRLRIPSNSSTVSASTTGTGTGNRGPSASPKVALPFTLLDHKTFSTPNSVLPLSTSGIYGGSTHGGSGSGLQLFAHSSAASVGDRSSLVSSNGGTGLPPYEVKRLKCTKDGSPGSPLVDPREFRPDDYRLITIERSSALIGIQILRTRASKGVFVKMVTERSLAFAAGIQVGDQIFDICGINMRTADYENAAKVLKQCRDPVQMLVQYQGDKFREIWSSMSEAERCNSMDSVGLSGASSGGGAGQGSGPGTGSGTDNRQTSADSIIVNDDDLESESSSRCRANGADSLPHRYSLLSEDAQLLLLAEQQSSASASGSTSGSGTGTGGRALRRASSRRSGGGSSGAGAGAAEEVATSGSGLVIYHSRHSTLTNDDISSTSATSTLTRRPKVASLPHECSLLYSDLKEASGSPTSTSNEEQGLSSARSSQANILPHRLSYATSSPSSAFTSATKEDSTTALHGSTALYHQQGVVGGSGGGSGGSPNSGSFFGDHPHQQQHQHHGHHHHLRQDSQSPPSAGGGGPSPSTSPNSGKVPDGGGTAPAKDPTEPSAEYRRIVIENPTSSLGISLVGGNAIGIYVHQIRDEALLSTGLAPGDQILEYNGTDLRRSTAEQAAIELAKPADVVRMLVQHNPARYEEIQETTIGDSFYIKTAFDRPSIDGSLTFSRGQILYIDNTMYQGVPGVWAAWSVGPAGEKERFGVIPSKYKAEEELMMKRSCYETGASGNSHTGNGAGSSSIGSTTRRSFFRRRKTTGGSGNNGGSGNSNAGSGNSHSGSGGAFSTIAGAMHFRSSSRDSTSKEIACYSDLASLKGPPHLGPDGEPTGTDDQVDTSAAPEYPVPPTYVEVRKLSYDFPRPIIIIGPLKELFIERLEQEYPEMFLKCLPEVIVRQHFDDPAALDAEVMERWMQEKALFDSRRRGSYVECSTLGSVKKICDNNLHPVLDINQNKAVSRLIAAHLYPVVVYLKFKSTKQIKEINRCPTEKLSSKAAKEMYEHSLKIETELKELINVTIAGNNLSYMVTQIKKNVDMEQQRALWL